MDFDVVVLAGGEGRRLGGVDKASLRVGSRTLLDGVLLATASARTTVVVGPERPTSRPVTWARESPPGGGPLAALAAGVTALDPSRRHGTTPVPATRSLEPGGVPSGRDGVLVLAVDLPYLSAAHVAQLLETLATSSTDAVAFAEGGRTQLLTAAYRPEALRRALAAVGDPHDAPVRLLREHLVVAPIEAAGGDVLEDCDTPEQLADVRARLGGEG